MLLHRYNDNPDSPVNDVDYAMFADNSMRCENYGDVHWVVDSEDLVDLNEIRDAIAEQFVEDLEAGVLANYNDLETIGTAILDEIDPDNIVLSAEAWDHEGFVGWVWDRVLDAKCVAGVLTQDGAIVFDLNQVRRVES